MTARDDDATVHDALAYVQRNLPDVAAARVADTGKFTYRYASLNDVHDAILPILDAASLLWTVTGVVEDGPARFTGRLTHLPSDTFVVTSWPMPPSPDPQVLGAALTYARRYMLCALVGLVPDTDTDGRPPARPAATEPTQTMRELLDLIDEAHEVGVVGDFDATVEYAAEAPANLAAAYRKIEAAVEARRADHDASHAAHG